VVCVCRQVGGQERRMEVRVTPVAKHCHRRHISGGLLVTSGTSPTGGAH
jgi:hypothetical protein